MQPVTEHLILVNERDEQVGICEKMQAHRDNLLHRAFSVFLFNKKGEMLLQQRASGKYHSGGLWTNTCCSHPRPGEDTLPAAQRRLQEEMGMTCALHEVFQFTYQARLEDDLYEHELDHVFLGRTDETPQPDSQEVQAWRYITKSQLRSELLIHPEKFTVWFRQCINQVWDACERFQD